MKQNFLEKITDAHAVKKFPNFMKTR